jgi:CPA1 family monovalent cation:H+ antiporter
LAYGSFLIAEQLHWSGVLSTVFAGIVAGSVGARFGMSPSTKNAVEDFWEFGGFIANSFIFLLVGLELEPLALVRNGGAAFIAFAAVCAARAAVIYVGVPVANRWAQPLPAAWRHVLVWGGLRGSLSMVLILTLPSDFEGRSMLVTLVFGVVGLSLFMQGLTMGPLLKRLGLLEGKARHDVYEQARATSIMTRRALEELDDLERDGLLEPQVSSRLRQWYADRGRAAELQAKQALGSAQIIEQLAEAMRRLSEAERHGLREAEQAAIIDAEIAEQLDRELSLRLVELDEAQGAPAKELEPRLERLLAGPRTDPPASDARSHQDRDG